MKKQIVIGIVILFIGMSVVPSTAIKVMIEKPSTASFDGNTLYVGGSGEGNYSNIQDAIDDANPGDTVFVYDDSSPYYENILIDKSINLIGEDKTSTSIDGEGGRIIVIIKSSTVEIIDFTLKNTEQSGFAEAIRIFNETSVIENIGISDCIIQQCGKGIYGTGVSFLTINNCEIFNNLGACVFIDDSDHITIDSCIFYNNGEEFGNDEVRSGGITIWGYEQQCMHISIFDCDIHENIGIGIDIIQSENIEVYNCDVYDNTWMGTSLLCLSNLNVHHNNFQDNKMYGILIEATDNNTIYKNDIVGNGKSESYHSGLLLASCEGSVFIYENTVTSNRGMGIALGIVSSAKVSNNEITGNIFEGIQLKYNSNENIISNNTLNDNSVGITIDGSNDNIVVDNLISSNDFSGVRIHSDSQNNLIANNNIDLNKRYGFHLTQSNGSKIFNNLIESNSYDGIRLDFLKNCIIKNNQIVNNNMNGIRIFSADANTIYENNISQNEIIGIDANEYSFDNLIYHNNLINYNNAIDKGINRWDSNYPSCGNYWFDYTGTDNDGDGIGDTPYDVKGGDNQDRYPFINPNGWANNTPQGPDLECVGSLRWGSVKPGTVLTAKIYVKNIGKLGSELDWTISSYPEWGTWTFTPSSGTGLTPEDGITTIEVTIVAPENKQEFGGTVKIVNIHDSDDFCNLQVTLTTPRHKPLNTHSFFKWFLEQYPMLNRLLYLTRMI